MQNQNPDEDLATPSSGGAVWEKPAEKVALPEGEVHVWRSCLTFEPAQLQILATLLCEEERARHDHMAFQRNRDQFTAAHGLLRLLLGRYAALAPEKLRFQEGPNGKPYLKGEGADLCFNLSHADDLALLAVARRRELGVDVERISPGACDEELVARLFAAGEIRTLHSLPQQQRPAAFFRCWTRKEAFVKALGRGLSLDLKAFEVSLAPDQPPTILYADGANIDPEHWRMCDVDPGPSYTAALCCEGHGWTLRCWDWPQDWIR